MNVQLLPPPVTSNFALVPFSFRIIRQHGILLPPLRSTNSTAVATTASISSKRLYLDMDDNKYDVASLENRRYDFEPLLQFLSLYHPTSAAASGHEPAYSSSPISLDPTELRLAESYRAVPAPLWHSLIKSLSSSPSSISTAYALVTWLQKHNLCFSYELLYSILIHALGRSEKLYEAFLLSQRQRLTPMTYNALIGACARNDEIEKALNLIARMRRDGYQSDFVNYSLIIQAMARSNKIDSSMLLKLYEEIEADMIELDAHLLNDMTVGFAKAGDVDRALHFLAIMQGNGLSPKTATLVSVVSELGNLGRAEEAEAVFEELREDGLKPRTRAYNALLKAYVKTGSFKDAEHVVSEMKTNGVSPDEQTYSLLIDGYGNAGRWESAKLVLKDMETNNVPPNAYVFSRILASCRDKGEWQRSFQILKEMRNIGVRPDRLFYNVMIDSFGKYNCLDHSMAAFEQMKSEGIQPDNVTWNTLIDCHCKLGHHSEAEKLFEAMEESGCMPCTTTYNIMINSYGQQERWEEVKTVLGKMQSQGLLPNVVTYTTLVDIYGQAGKFDEAVESMEVMKSSGLKPSSTMYNALINAYAQRVCCY